MRLANTFAFAFVFVLAACGGKSVAPADDLPAGGRAQGGSVNQAGGGNSSSGGKGGSGAACSSFADEVGSFIGVDIINQTSSALYLGQPEVTCETEPLFAVSDQNGFLLRSPRRCRSGCGADAGGCTAICLYPAAIELAPGATLSTSWSGLFDIDVDLPDACGGSARQCQQSKLIQPGVFAFMASAGSSLRCADDVGCDDGCQNGAEGVCTTQGALIAGTMHSANAVVQLDASYGVFAHELPAPGAGAPSDSSALQTVKIVFEK